MKYTIANLWNGNIEPIKNIERNNPEIQDLTKMIERNGEDLDKTLNEQQKTIFEKYVCCTGEYLTLVAEQAFCDGFCLGGKLVSEALAVGE